LQVSYDYFSDTFSVTASRDYRAGEQVFVNYGQTNDGLMQYYGFTEVGWSTASFIISFQSHIPVQSIFLPWAWLRSIFFSVPLTWG